jgi:hypothetical protein
MTLLVAWTGIDTHGPASIYIASDSRITWIKESFDHARKVFAFRRWPDILGYCGDVLFPSIALNQIVELADAGLLFAPDFSCEQKFEAIVEKLNDLFRAYPQFESGLAANELYIIHASRDQVDSRKFSCYTIAWTQKGNWSGKERDLPDKSGLLFSLGTGKGEFNANYTRYSVGPNQETSRNVFHCLCDTVARAITSTVGGAPQLVGIYRKPDSPAFNTGVIFNNRRYFLGVHIDNLGSFDAIEWRNSNFERCDGRTMQRLPYAQSQPDPLRRS